MLTLPVLESRRNILVYYILFMFCIIQLLEIKMQEKQPYSHVFISYAEHQVCWKYT